MDRKAHWENIYETKPLESVSWYQKEPTLSLQLIDELCPSKDVSILDVGGGDSFLVDYLIKKEYSELSVLDISEKALVRGAERLADAASKVDWICADITAWNTTNQYAIWHDRAAFHFLREKSAVASYVALAGKTVSSGGSMIIATFAKDGPQKCSGIEIQQYNEEDLKSLFKDNFQLEQTHHYQHPTPFDTTQSFIYCVFKRN